MRLVCLSPVTLTLLAPSLAAAATLQVGPGKPYAAPCAAIAAAAAGDTIEIDGGGSYDGDVCSWTTNGLTLRGVNGRPHIDAAGKNAGGKAIWVIGGDDTTVDGVELSGCTVPDDNGAGIRQEGRNLTVLRSYFHDNQDGILAGDKAGSTITIEYSEFANNGAGDGQSHNLYINHVDKLVFRFNWSHGAKIGHLLKSRALENHILYNRLTGETGGTESYEINLPSGGTSYVIGNLIEQPSTTDNSAMLDYLSEPGTANPDKQLYVINNTFVNDRGSGTFVQVGASTTTPAIIKNNIFAGGGTECSQASAVLDHNYTGDGAMFVDAANYDYRLLAGSPCIDAGVDPGSANGESLTPTDEYVHPAGGEPRAVVGAIDVGAYELGAGAADGGAGAGGSAGGGGSAGAGGSAGGGAGADAGGGAGGGAGADAGGSAGGSADSGTAADSGAGTAPAGGGGDSGGCGCRVGGGASGGAAAGMLALVVLGAARRRRRNG